VQEKSTAGSPLYQQVKAVLRQQIESGQYPVSTTLPTEHDLSRSFQCSRATIRNAIRELVIEGYVKPRSGIGTIVIRSRSEKRSDTMRGLTEELKDKGFPTEAVVLQSNVVTASPSVRTQLELFEGERVLHLIRLRTIAGRPFALLNAFVPATVGISADEDFSGPLYDLIERSHGMRISYGRDAIGSRGAREDEAKLLQIEADTPVLVIRRTAFLEYDKPIEYVEATIRGDLYEYTVTLPR
jgi:GntR family transcriptional regulator